MASGLFEEIGALAVAIRYSSSRTTTCLLEARSRASADAQGEDVHRVLALDCALADVGEADVLDRLALL